MKESERSVAVLRSVVENDISLHGVPIMVMVWPHKDKFNEIYASCSKRIYYNSEERKSRKQSIDWNKSCSAQSMWMFKSVTEL